VYKNFVVLCAFMAGVYAASFGLSDKPVTLSSLPALVDTLMKAEPEKKSFDGDIILAAHKRFIDLLDPEKSYFLAKEAAAFLDPAKQKEYAADFANGTYESYRNMAELFQKAIQRSQSIRKNFRSVIFSQQDIDLSEFPATKEQLEAKVAWLFFASRVQQNAPKRTVADLERQEELWSAPHEELLAQTILKSVLTTLDVNSDVMAHRDARNMREKLTKQAQGTGIVCEEARNKICVAHIQKGSPADAMGVLKKGDILLSIEGKSCQNLSLDEVDDLLREKDTGSVLVAWQGDDGGILEQKIPLRAFILEEDRVQGQREGDILVIKVPCLYSNGKGVSTTEDMLKILTAQQNPVSGVLLDLRGNGGGYLTEAIGTCGLFIKTGVILTALYANGKKAVYRDTDPRVFFDGPIVILISERTASAAEIVAQTLKDYGKAIIVGSESSFGKGSIQMQTCTDVKGPDDIPLRYTVGKFYSVSGVSPNGAGVKADIVLPGFPKKGAHDISAPSLPETLPAEFNDTLEDIKGAARFQYKKYYMPYLQERERKYRKLISLLKAKSHARMKKQFPHPLAEKEKYVEQISAAQLHEAEAILQDLIQEQSQ
jgi:carboxyl-terminal processing protease